MITQTTMRLTAEVEEENDAVGVNDLTTCIFTSVATLPNLSPPCSFSPNTNFEHWHTHTVRHHWVCAGMLLEVNRLLFALNAETQSHYCLVPKPTMTTPQSTSKWIGWLVYKNQNFSLSLSNIAVNSSKTIPVCTTHGWELTEETGFEIRLLRFNTKGSWVPIPFCCSVCSRTISPNL